jgi:hypothetical protein
MADDDMRRRARNEAKMKYAREQYESRPARDELPDSRDQPYSGRFFIWYGWKDKVREPIYPINYTHAYTFQCSNINPDTNLRCKREVCIGSQYCTQHLRLLGISLDVVYKANTSIIDRVRKVEITKAFDKDSIVLRLHGEFLSEEDHLKRYQKKNACGPHEFGFKARNRDKYIYIDLVRSSNEAGYLPVSDDGNLYIDINGINFDNQVNKIFNLRAVHDLVAGEELKINSKSTNFHFLPQATHETAYYFDNIFGFRGLPLKYRNREYADLINPEKRNMHGLWVGRGLNKRARAVPEIDEEDDMEGDDELEEDDNGDGGDAGDDNNDDNNNDANRNNPNLMNNRQNMNLQNNVDAQVEDAVQGGYEETKGEDERNEAFAHLKRIGEIAKKDYDWDNQSEAPSEAEQVKIPKELTVEAPNTAGHNYVRTYYKIPNYKNKYNTQDYLRIGISGVQGGGLGLFAFMTWEDRQEALGEGIRRKNGRPLVFKGYLRKSSRGAKSYIDEYRGEHITAANADEMDKKLDEIGDSAYRTYVSGKLVIDALNPTDCYARYANDPREDYNAQLISSSTTKTAAIIAIKDIFADDEIVVNYSKRYWKGLKPMRGLNKLPLEVH